MRMRMLMVIIAHDFGNSWAKKLVKCAILNDLLWFARATDMVKQAVHHIGVAHHKMQIMRNHQHRATSLMLDSAHQLIHR